LSGLDRKALTIERSWLGAQADGILARGFEHPSILTELVSQLLNQGSDGAGVCLRSGTKDLNQRLGMRDQLAKPVHKM
jgi:hypothetical protein